MFGKVKKWLGIEGAKIELIVPDEIQASSGSVSGKLRFQSMNEQTVTSVTVKLIERYSRGRRKNKMTDEYEFGKIVLEDSFLIPADEEIEIDFTLPFKIVKSDMDELGDKNFVTGGLVGAAKWIKGVKSEFRIEAEATVKGVALNPFDKKVVIVYD